MYACFEKLFPVKMNHEFKTVLWRGDRISRFCFKNKSKIKYNWKCSVSWFLGSYLYNKTRHSLNVPSDRSNGWTEWAVFFVDTHGKPGSDKGGRKFDFLQIFVCIFFCLFHRQRRAFQLVLYKYIYEYGSNRICSKMKNLALS